MIDDAKASPPSFRRSLYTPKSIVRSKTSALAYATLSRYSRVSVRPGALTKAVSRAYSTLDRRTLDPWGSISCSGCPWSCQPANLCTIKARSHRGSSPRIIFLLRTARIRASSSRALNGVIKQSSAPSSKPTMRSASSVPVAAIMITGTSEHARISFKRRNPSARRSE